MRQLMKMLSVAAMLAISACGGGDDLTGPDEEDESSVTATVSGTAFTAANFNIPARVPNRLFFSASEVVGAQARTHLLEISLDPITGTGTFPVGPTSTNLVTYGEVGSGGVTNYWRSSSTGGTGAVNVTVFTNARVAGNFSVTLGPDRGSTGTKTATGTFDIYFE